MESEGRSSSENVRYSDPMPVIGLYIAGATLVCFLLMLCDIFNGIRQRKRWIPCQFFVLNSFTLTLLSIAAKLPVDLTTSMPSAYDQLSKLCGTSLICISIGFLYPSVGNVSASELFVNLASLNIMVITVTVNISIQMTTGVIFLFKVEHVIILVSMLLLLGLTCATKADVSGCELASFQETIRYKPKSYIKTLLEECYIFGYITNPQFDTCRYRSNASVAILCTICLVTSSEAAIRAFHRQGLEFLFNKQASDYKWSVSVVLIIQFLTLIVGALAVAFRWIALATQFFPTPQWITRVNKKYKFQDGYQGYLICYKNWELYFQGFMSLPRQIFQIFKVLQSILDSMLYLMETWACFIDFYGNFMLCVARDCLALAMRKTGFCFSFLEHDGDVDHETVASLRNELKNMTAHSFSKFYYSDYLLWKSKKDAERLIKKHSAHPPNSVVQFLGRDNTSCHQPVLLRQIDEGSDKLLLLVCLVRMVYAMVPYTRSRSLVFAFDEIFEIILFIHCKTQPVIRVPRLDSKILINIAKDIWISRGNRFHWFHNSFIKHLNNGEETGDRSSAPLGHALKIVELSLSLHMFMRQELSDIIEIISGNDQAAPMEDVYNCMEQLFVELLHWYIDQFPDAVFNSLTEPCIGNQFEENSKLCLKFFSKLGSLEVDWGCIGKNIMSFMTTDLPFGAPPNQVVRREHHHHEIKDL